MTHQDFGDIVGDWDYSELPGNIILGRECWLERKSSFAAFQSERQPGMRFGDRARVYTWATFNVEPTGLIEVGADCVLVGPTFMCARHIVLGNRVFLSYQVTIADSDFHPLDPDERKRDAIAVSPFGDRSQRPRFVSKPVIIEDDVQVGIGAMILKGVRIGQGARIGPGSVITTDVPPGAVMAGNPARPQPE